MNNSLLILFLYHFLCATTFAAPSKHWDRDQTKRYAHNSDLQLRSNWQFLSGFLSMFKGNEKILDIGSGDGKMSSFLAGLVKKGEVIGLEPNNHMRAWANKQYCQEEYPNLSFKEGSYSTINEEEVYKFATAFFSFHTLELSKRDAALSSIYKALKPSGRLIMTIAPGPNSNPMFAKAISRAQLHERWKLYFRNRQANLKFESIDEIRDRLERSPFEESSVSFKKSKDPFVDKIEFAEWILGTMEFIQEVPSEHRLELANYIIDQYVELKPDAKANGVYFGAWGRIEVVAKKLYSSKVNSSIFGS